MASLEELKQAITLCHLAEVSNQRKHPYGDPSILCRDRLNDSLQQMGFQVLESLELIPFPHNLCNGFIVHNPNTGSLIVALSATPNWRQRSIPNLWDRSINWNGKGGVAQVFVDASATVLDTIRLALRRLPPTQNRHFQIVGFGLASPIAYLLGLIANPLASELGYQVRTPILFACPKFVESTFYFNQPRQPIISLALDEDLLPRMPVTPLNWQWTWISTPLVIDSSQSYYQKPLAEDPLYPAQSRTCMPEDYFAKLNL